MLNIEMKVSSLGKSSNLISMSFTIALPGNRMIIDMKNMVTQLLKLDFVDITTAKTYTD